MYKGRKYKIQKETYIKERNGSNTIREANSLLD